MYSSVRIFKLQSGVYVINWWCASCLLRFVCPVLWGDLKRLSEASEKYLSDGERQSVLHCFITFISICSVRQRAGRGLTTQKRSRPSTSLFLRAHSETGCERDRNGKWNRAMFDRGMHLLKPVLFRIVYFVLDACKCCAYITYEVVAEMVENSQYLQLYPLTASNPLVLSDTKDMFSFPG